MGWQNIIVGYEIKGFSKEDIIPVDAKFLYTKERFVRMVGRAVAPHPYYETVLFYQVPIYKKKNIKTNT